jgi:hypothetical protein
MISWGGGFANMSERKNLSKFRNDAPNGLWINTLNIKGCQVHEEYTPTDVGIPPINYTTGRCLDDS